MKFISQIPLLLITLITYIIVSLTTPSSLGIITSHKETTPDKVVETNDETSITATEEASEVLTATETVATSEAVSLDPFEVNPIKPVLALKLISGATWRVNLGELFIVFSLFLLFIEIFKSTRTSNASIIDHLLSTLLFIIHLVLFIVWDRAGTSVFFILSMISLVDVMCGFTVSIAAARRDVGLTTNSL